MKRQIVIKTCRPLAERRDFLNRQRPGRFLEVMPRSFALPARGAGFSIRERRYSANGPTVR